MEPSRLVPTLAPSADLSSQQTCEVAVVGAGAVGLTLAIALARAGLDTCLIGATSPRRNGRTVALLQGSVQLLDRIGAWPRLAQHAAPLVEMRIVDATGSLFATPPVRFRAGEIDLPAFGFNIENADLEAGLDEIADTTTGLRRVRGAATALRFASDTAMVETPAGTVRAQLVIGCDGRRSIVRRSARIGIRDRAVPQIALTTILAHERPHRDVSTEFHTREGPFTLVPLPGTDREPHRSSLVWVMAPARASRLRAASPDDFARAVEDQSRHLLGAVRVTGEIGAFPISTLTATRATGLRTVLVGEAAHALPPIGAQGLNLSFRDIAVLADLLRNAKVRGIDLGAATLIERFARSRAGDVAARTFGVNLLNDSLLSRTAGRDLLRGFALSALAHVGPLRRLAMREGLAGSARRTGGANAALDAGAADRR